MQNPKIKKAHYRPDLFALSFRYLRDSLHFVDKRRVAVWGWSYGGFMAAMALAREQEVFHCGISVAPVTTWRLYGQLIDEKLMCSLDKTY
jgi:dipeptidyl aminopeptidase/acylaminoacyl peptidase